MDNVIIASSAMIEEGVSISPFCVIGENVIIRKGATLGVGCVLSDGAQIGPEVQLGHYVTVGKDAVIGARVMIGDHTTIYSASILGEGTYIGSNSSIGRPPKASSRSTVKNHHDLSPLTIGKQSIIGCSTVIYAGSTLADSVFVGDRTLIRERCKVGHKVVVGSGATVENDTQIGASTKIQTGSYITAYMEIGENVFIAPMVTTTNDNYMGRTQKRFLHIRGATIHRGARIGGGAILLPGVDVAEETFVAAGSLVTKDTQPRKVVKGFPAKTIRDVSEDELVENNG